MFVNRRTVRIEWGDCDPAGIVYFPRYVEYFDICTAHLFEAAGFPKAETLKRYDAAGYPMVDLKMKFMLPASFGDDVDIESTLTEIRRSSFTVQHRLFRGEQLAVEGFETRVWTVRDPSKPGRLKSEPMPEEIKAALS